MAQQIKLKRSAIAGKVPLTSSLDTGELAINTADGKLYFKRDDDTIQTIVTTNTLVTGSLDINGPVTASFFKGDGSAITGVISSSYTATASYVNPLTQTVEITGSFLVTGSTVQTGNNTLTGNTTLSGSVDISGSTRIFGTTNFSNSTTTITGSLLVTGSTTQIGNNTLAGNTTLSGSIIMSGSLGSTPTVRIYGDTQHNGYIRFEPVTTNIDSSISASYIYVSGSTNDLYFSQNGAGYANTTRLRWLEGNLYTGLLNGGRIIAPTGSTQFTVLSGSGVIVNLNASLSDNPYPTIQYVNWPTFTSQSLTYLTSSIQSYIGIDGAGAVIQQNTPYINGEYNTQILLGTVLHQNLSTINASITYPNVAYGWKQRSYDFVKAFGPLKLSGLTIVPSASLQLTIGSGTAWADGRNYQTDPNNPSYITDPGTTVSKIFRYYQSGSSFVQDTNGGLGYTVIDPANYNPGGLGVLTAVPGSGINRQWSIQRVFWYPNSATKGIVVYYGSSTYATEIDAAANLPYEAFQEVENTKQNAVYLGALVLRNDAVFTDTTSYKVLPGGLFRSIGGSGGGGNISSLLLSQLGDVTVTGTTDRQALVYDTATLKWINSSFISASISGNAGTATTASYVATASYVPTLQQVTSQGNTTTGSINIAGITNDGNLFLSGSNRLVYNNSVSSSLLFGFFDGSSIYGPYYQIFGNSYSNLTQRGSAEYVYDTRNGGGSGFNIASFDGSTWTRKFRVNDNEAQVTGSLNVTQDLIVGGRITAEEFHTEFVSASIIYQSGSTKFGNSSDDVHSFTGSLYTTGKVTIGTVDNFGSDPDKFLAITNGEVVYRTGAQLLSDIGGQTAGTFVQNDGSGGQARYIMRYADSNSATTSSIYEDTSGRIGIKTTTPAYPLDISGSFRATSNSNIVGFIKSTSAFGATISYQDPSTSGNDWVSAGAYGNSFVIATGLQVKAVVDVNGHTYPNSDKLQDFGSGSNRWRTVYADDVNASGKIGVNTLTPRARLEISGSNAIINEHTFGRGSSTSLDTIAIGSGSLSTANTVSAGVFIGTNAGMKNTQGQNSVVIGNYAAYSGSNVRDSVIIGDSAGAIPRLSSTQFPYQDVYIGRYSGYNNNGYWNTAIGYSAMREQNQLSSAQATNNVAVGTFALYGDDFQGNENVGIGVDALAEIQSGSENIGIGTRALVSLKNAGSNIAIGYRAFHSFDNNAAASPQGGFGSGTSNVGLGSYVGYNLLSGSFNTFLGPYAGADYYTGSQNVVLGYDRANDLNNTQGNLAITAGGRRVIHSRDGVTTLSGSLALKGTTTVIQQGILVSGTTSLTVASISTGSYEGAFLDYVITSGSNKRAGTLATVWTPSDIEWNDVSTLDLGSTVGAEFTPTLAGSNANLVLAVPTGTWTVKGHLRYM